MKIRILRRAENPDVRAWNDIGCVLEPGRASLNPDVRAWDLSNWSEVNNHAQPLPTNKSKIAEKYRTDRTDAGSVIVSFLILIATNQSCLWNIQRRLKSTGASSMISWTIRLQGLNLLEKTLGVLIISTQVPSMRKPWSHDMLSEAWHKKLHKKHVAYWQIIWTGTKTT